MPRTAVRAPTSESTTVPVTMHEERESSEPVTMPRGLYNNREDGYPALAGWHYITLETSPGESKAALPVKLYVSTGGKPVDAPDYAVTAAAPGGPVAEPGGGPGANGPTEAVSAVRPAAVSASVRLWVCIGVVAAAVLLGAVLLLVRRSRRTPDGARFPYRP